jgi:hypothetical protein
MWTVRKWRRRGKQGRKALASAMGRPASGALSTYPVLIRETLRAWRRAHPGWGAKTLRAELEADERFKGLELPGHRTMARFLNQEGFTRSYEKHSALPPSSRSVAQAPHQAWEMDGRGHEYISDVGVVTLIDLNDRFSRVRLLSYPCLLGKARRERAPATEDYQLVLRLAFADWGLPDYIAVDHDSVFYDNATKSPFPTRLHLWLLALGVSLTFGRMGRATDQGLTECSHQLWEKQVLLGQSFTGWSELYHTLRRRRDFLNTRLPCASMGNVPPLVACPDAQIPRRPYRPEWEAQLLALSGVYAYLAKGRWFRKVSKDGTVSLGSQVYILGRAWTKKKQQQVEITFDPSGCQLLFRSEDGEQTKKLDIKGITPQTLMGEMGPLVGLPAFQLALPLAWDAWRAARHCDTLGA